MHVEVGIKGPLVQKKKKPKEGVPIVLQMGLSSFVLIVNHIHYSRITIFSIIGN